MSLKLFLVVTCLFALTFFVSNIVQKTAYATTLGPTVTAPAQKGSAAELIKAEYRFAHGAIVSKKIAFDKYLADDCVVLRKGGVINAKKYWADIGKDTSQLIWYPVFADVASSGEFGYTTGAWQIKASSKAKEAVYFGEYITVWQKQSNGEWKVTVDLGINHPKPAVPEPAAVAHDGSVSAAIPKTTLASAETAYNSMLKNNPAGGYKSYFSNTVRVFRPDEMPFTNLPAALKSSEAKAVYNCVNVKQSASRSGDFAYTYGVVARKVKGKETKTNYLRMWKVENGNWKIVLDVITG